MRFSGRSRRISKLLLCLKLGRFCLYVLAGFTDSKEEGASCIGIDEETLTGGKLQKSKRESYLESVGNDLKGEDEFWIILLRASMACLRGIFSAAASAVVILC